MKQKTTTKAEEVFPGEWVWAGGTKKGVTRMVIAKSADGWTMQTWGEKDGKEHDGGKAALALLRDYDEEGETDEQKTMNKYGFAIRESKAPKAGVFAKSHFTVRVKADRLLVEEYRIFTDKSNRPNYLNRYELKKK